MGYWTCADLQASLELALDLLMSEEAYAVPGLRPAVGRLANALVAVLGPELRLGSDAYVKCKSLIREMQVGAQIFLIWFSKKK